MKLKHAATRAANGCLRDSAQNVGAGADDPKPKKAPAVAVKKEAAATAPAATAATSKKAPAPAAEPPETKEVSKEVGNRVVEISLPVGKTVSAPPSAVTGHPGDGNKVAMSPPPAPEESAAATTVDAALAERCIRESSSTRVDSARRWCRRVLCALA